MLRRRAERLTAPRFWPPRVWLPRGGLLRAVGVVALVATAGFLLVRSPSETPVAPEPGRVSAPGRVNTPVSAPAPVVTAEAAVGACRSGRAAPPHGAVGFPLRLPDSAVLAVLRAGQHVDVLAGTGDGTVTAVAADVPVLCAVGAADQPDGVLYLAVSSAQATVLAAIGPGVRLSVTVRSPG